MGTGGYAQGLFVRHAGGPGGWRPSPAVQRLTVHGRVPEKGMWWTPVNTRWVLHALHLASGVWGQGAARSRACVMERRQQLDQQVLPDGSGCGRGGQGPGSCAGTLWPGSWGHFYSVSYGKS